MSEQERPIVKALRSAKDAGEEAGPKAGRKARSLLPSSPPPPGSSTQQTTGWLTVALALGADPVTGAESFGRHVEARLVVILESGRRITFDPASNAFDGPRLVQTVMMATGAQVPPYGRADATQIVGAILRVSTLLADADGRGEAVEWGRSFLEAAQTNAITVEGIDTPAARYAALSALVEWTAPPELPPYTPAAERAALIVDSQTGVRLLRVSHFAAHVRGLIGRPLGWAALHGRMVEVGWEHRGEVEQRRPNFTGKRVKAHVYAVAAGWEHS